MLSNREVFSPSSSSIVGFLEIYWAVAEQDKNWRRKQEGLEHSHSGVNREQRKTHLAPQVNVAVITGKAQSQGPTSAKLNSANQEYINC